MAAPTTVQNSVDLKIAVGINALAFGTGATLTAQRAVTTTPTDSDGLWQDGVYAVRQASITADGLFGYDDARLDASDLAVTIGGAALKGVTNVDLELACNLIEVVSVTTGHDRVLVPDFRSVSLRVQGDYYDPAGTGAGASQALIDEVLGVTSAGLAVVVDLGDTSFAGTFFVESVGVTKAVGDVLKQPVTLRNRGAVTPTLGADLDVGLDALLDAFFAASASTAVNVEATTQAPTHTEYQGSGYLARLTISVDYRANETRASAQIEISGGLAAAVIPSL